VSTSQNPPIADLSITKPPTTICARILLILNATLFWFTTFQLVGLTQRLSLVWVCVGLWPVAAWIALTRLRIQANGKASGPVRKAISLRLLCILNAGMFLAGVCGSISMFGSSNELGASMKVLLFSIDAAICLPFLVLALFAWRSLDRLRQYVRSQIVVPIIDRQAPQKTFAELEDERRLRRAWTASDQGTRSLDTSDQTPLGGVGQSSGEADLKLSPLIDPLDSEWNDLLAELATKIKSLIDRNSALLERVLPETDKAPLVRQSFVKHQIFAYLFIFTLQLKKRRYSGLDSDHQHQLIREIRSHLPLLNYSSEHLFKEFHEFEAGMVLLTGERRMKLFIDLTKEDINSSLSIPGLLSYRVCAEAQISCDPGTTLFVLFNNLIESMQKEALVW